jgi:hypothetical protein
MKSKIGFTLLFLLGFVLGLVLLANDARAQQPPADVNKADKDKAQQPAASGQNGAEGPYTITSSIEFGVRGVLIEGNGDRYRSDLNYTPGFRIFDSSFLMKSKDNNAPVFDTLMVSSFGWGKDPNKYLRVNAEKTKAYRFDANYRRFDYFNNLSNFALGQHTSNTEYRQGDFNLTILPQNEKLRFNLGYSLDRNSGPSVSTMRFNGDEYPAAVPVRMAADEFRVGVDAKLWVFDLSFMQGWRYFKEDNQYLVTVPNPGNNLTNTAKITDFYRNAPTRGSTPFTRFSLHTLIAKKLDFTGRYVYTSGSTTYTFFQNGHGTDSSGNTVNSDIIIQNGSAKRPNGMGDLAATFYATDSFRISETFRVNSFRINGGDLLLETLLRSKAAAGGGVTVLPPVVTNLLSFRTIDYRRYLNTIEADFDINSRLSIHAGYRYADRHIELGSSDITVGAAANPTLEKVDNSTNTFIFGFKAKPVKIWSVYMDMERGSADNVFTRVDNYKFTNVRVRSILRPNRTLSFNASLVTKDNSNPAIAETSRTFGVNIKSRVFTSSIDWSPNEKFGLNGGYTRTNVTSDADIILFLANVQTFGQSRYFMRDNFFFATGYVRLGSRATLFGGYRIHDDTGQSDRASTPSLLIGSFPYDLQSPEAKVVIKLHKNVDWIAGYQYFGYEENFPNTAREFYHAHLPYTSLRIYFGRE